MIKILEVSQEVKEDEDSKEALKLTQEWIAHTRSERIQTPGEVIDSLSMKMTHLLTVKKKQEEDVKVIKQGWRAECWDSNLSEC